MFWETNDSIKMNKWEKKKDEKRSECCSCFVGERKNKKATNGVDMGVTGTGAVGAYH